MPHCPPPMGISLTRRRLLQAALGGAAGLVAWHQGWSHLRSAAAQKDTPTGQMTWAIHVTLCVAFSPKSSCDRVQNAEASLVPAFDDVICSRLRSMDIGDIEGVVATITSDGTVSSPM